MSSFTILGMSQEDFRNWIILFLGIIGAYITIQTYIKSLEQSKLENTFKTLDFLRRHITENEKLRFVELFHARFFQLYMALYKFLIGLVFGCFVVVTFRYKTY